MNGDYYPEFDGDWRPPRPSWVGERGPEWFVPTTDIYVLPFRTVEDIARGVRRQRRPWVRFLRWLRRTD